MITNYSMITAQEAKQIMDNEDVVIMDVRTKDEYDQGHIKDSLLLPLDQLDDNAEEKVPDKSKKILVYCRSGVRSATAAHKLLNMGYTNIHNFGGIIDWPYEIDK